MDKKRIKYTIEKSRESDGYVLWKNVESSHGAAVKRMYKGTRRDCFLEKKKREEMEKI